MDNNIYSIQSYPDGSSYVKIKTLGEIFKGSNVVTEQWMIDCAYDVTWRINSYNDLWQLHQYVDAVNNQGVEPTIIIPNLIDGQADRRFNSNESAGLALILYFLKNMNADFRIFHPHNSEVVTMVLNNAEIISNEEFIIDVLNDICPIKAYNFKDQEIDFAIEVDDYTTQDHSNLIVLLPDGGAYKWGAKLMDNIGFEGTVTAAAKNRSFVNGNSVLSQQLPNIAFKGKDVLIIDDICINGGTFKGLASMLETAGVNKMYLAVSHMTIQNLKDDPITKYFHKVFTTNSKYDEYYLSDSKGEPVQPDNLIINKMF